MTLSDLVKINDTKHRSLFRTAKLLVISNYSMLKLLYWIIVITFVNDSNKPQAIRTKFGTRAQVKAKAKCGQNGGLGRLPQSRNFLCHQYTTRLFGNFTTADFHQIWPWHVNPCPLKIPFTGHLLPNKLTMEGVKQASYSVQPTAQERIAETNCSFHVVVQWSGSFSGRSIFLCDVRFWSYRAWKFPIFLNFAYFPI